MAEAGLAFADGLSRGDHVRDVDPVDGDPGNLAVGPVGRLVHEVEKPTLDHVPLATQEDRHLLADERLARAID
ncbi:MAG: hypothetical protein J0H25_11390, partial [Rhizobiales bacterium]|nr:hypothetical protein [Hyphomicrobiales bacterium]